jgi:tight adherence protein B
VGVVNALLGAVIGGGVGLGVFLAVAGWSGVLEGAPHRPRRALRIDADRLVVRCGLVLVGVVVAMWATGWVVAVAAFGLLGWMIPSFVGLRAGRRRRLARAEAVAVWAEMLRDLLVSNAGLHEAIGRSARVAPSPIRDEVKALYVRAQRGDLSSALGRFADEMDDAIADTVVTALQIADQRAVSDLGAMLAAVATSTRETVAMQLHINAARARIYRTAQLIAGIVAFFVFLLVATNPEYMEPFGTMVGQTVLAAVVALIGVSVWAMVLLSRPARAPRLLRVPGRANAGVRA